MPSTDLEEDIKSLIPREDEPEPKIPVYHSKYSHCIRNEIKKVKKCHQTMGYAQIRLDPPTKFLKKKTRTVRRPHVEKSKLNIERKPPLPVAVRVKSLQDKKPGAEKNFKQRNIVEAMRLVPKRPTPAFADTPHGDKQKLIPSGMMPQYIYKQGYGQIPNYLLERQKIAEEKERAARERQMKKKPRLRYITEDEREQLLEGLKMNWQDMQKEFQLLPMVTDTVPKIKRKTQLEKALKELEKDIELVERNPIIYVDEADENNRRLMNRLQQQCRKT